MKYRWIAILTALALASVATSHAASAMAPDEPARYYETLSLGSMGKNVLALTHLLDHHGIAVANQDRFNASLESAVKDFQTQNGLPADGVVDRTTWAALTPWTVQGHSGDKVLALTTLLSKYNNNGPTSYFTWGLKNKVKDFQTDMGLFASGNVNEATWENLVFHYELPSAFNSPGICIGTGGSGPNGYFTESWGTSSTVAYLESTGNVLDVLYQEDVAFRDLSFEHGGQFVDGQHGSHRRGMDIDIRPMAFGNVQCSQGVVWQYHPYNKWRTRFMFRTLKVQSSNLGGDLHKWTYFNDPWFLDRTTETSALRNHDDHLHTRFCTVEYPQDSSYEC